MYSDVKLNSDVFLARHLVVVLARHSFVVSKTLSLVLIMKENRTTQNQV